MKLFGLERAKKTNVIVLLVTILRQLVAEKNGNLI